MSLEGFVSTLLCTVCSHLLLQGMTRFVLIHINKGNPLWNFY